MSDGNEHDRCVESWLRRAPRGVTLEQQLRRFERAFTAVLLRAHQTLGEVTLMAILDRVLYVAAERFPLVSELEVESNQLSCRKLLLIADQLPAEQVLMATRFVMVEFLTVLGKLTAEILTPALHRELAFDVDTTIGDTRAPLPGSHAEKSAEETES